MSFENDAKQFNNQGFGGDFITKPGTLPCRFPSFGKPTVFRAFPCPDGNGGCLPWRSGPGADQFTDWVKLLPSVVRMAGMTRKITFLARPADAEGAAETPMGRIVRIVKAKAKTDPAWGQLLKGGPGKGADIPFIDNLIAMQGLLLFHNGNDLRAAPKNAVFVLPRTASQELLKVLHSEGKNVNSQNLEEVFLGGDVVHPDHGKLLTFKKAGEAQATTSGISFNTSGSGGQGPAFAKQEAKRDFVSYAVELSDSPPISPALINQLWAPWDSVINFLTTREQIEQLSTAYTPEFLAVVFRDSAFEQYVPETIRSRYFTSGAVQGVAFNGTAGYAQPPAAPPVAGLGLFTATPVPMTPPPALPVSSMPMPDAQPQTTFSPTAQSAPVGGSSFAAASANAAPAGFGGGINFAGINRDQDTQQQTPPAQNILLTSQQPAPGVVSSMNRLQSVLQAGQNFAALGAVPPAPPK